MRVNSSCRYYTTTPLYSGGRLGYNKGAKNDPNNDPKTTGIAREPAHGTDHLIWLLAAMAAQSARPDPGCAGAPGRLRAGHAEKDRDRRAPALAPARRTPGRLPRAAH